MMGAKHGTVAERFWRHVDTSGGPDACHPWTASTGSGGYGQLRVNGTEVPAHRIAFLLHYGEFPEGKPWALHNCPDGDNPACCNWRHLWAGTHQDNMDDMWRKGRAHPVTATNGRAHHAKLTRDQVEAIRSEYALGKVTQQSLADDYGVQRTTVSWIVSGGTWR